MLRTRCPGQDTQGDTPRARHTEQDAKDKMSRAGHQGWDAEDGTPRAKCRGLHKPKKKGSNPRSFYPPPSNNFVGGSTNLEG